MARSHAVASSLGFSLFLLATGSFAQGSVWIVDDDGGPGVDFDDLQPAIHAAADGETAWR